MRLVCSCWAFPSPLRPPVTKPPTIALLAGEASGDQLGGWLMAALKARRAELRFIGLGGPAMQAQGLDSLFPIRDLALIGIAEVLPRARTLRRRIRETVAFLEESRPDMVVSIDVPGFALRVLKQLHARGRVRTRLVHYVAPTVWAYRPKRAQTLAARVDHLLCLLPFEPPYFADTGLPTHFIGHEIAWWWREKGDGAAFRARHSIAPEAPLLAVFPGSRDGEIARLWPVFRATIDRLRATVPNLRLVLQVPDSQLDAVRARCQGWDDTALLLRNTEEKKDCFAAADAALAKSGTIGLECALAGLPHVIAYRANPVSVFLLRRMIRTPYIHLANILLSRPLVPELLQERCTPPLLSETLLPLLLRGDAAAQQRAGFAALAPMLGAQDAQSPSDKAADLLLQWLREPPPGAPLTR